MKKFITLLLVGYLSAEYAAISIYGNTECQGEPVSLTAMILDTCVPTPNQPSSTYTSCQDGVLYEKVFNTSNCQGAANLYKTPSTCVPGTTGAQSL